MGRARPALPEALARARAVLEEHKAEDIALLDLRGVASVTDFFLIASGRSDVHVGALADRVLDELERLGRRAYGVEGLRGGRWVVLDYVDFVVHIFHPQARAFYQLEALWADAPELPAEPPAAE